MIVARPAESVVAEASGREQLSSGLSHASMRMSGRGAFEVESVSVSETTLCDEGASGHVTAPTHAQLVPKPQLLRHDEPSATTKPPKVPPSSSA